MKKIALLLLAVTVFALLFAGCGNNGGTDPEKIVPARATLIDNLKNAGYAVEELDTVEGSGLTIDRVLARKDGRFIDIVYGLSGEEAEKVFELYCAMYPDNYYILARNGNYVYCVSDKRTFSKAGFKSTDNIGTQYIHG